MVCTNSSLLFISMSNNEIKVNRQGMKNPLRSISVNVLILSIILIA